jgi:hypothetical protein
LPRPLDLLPIAVRVYPLPENAEDDKRSRKWWRTPGGMIVFDTETRTDAKQTLTFGSYRFFVHRRCLQEGLFYSKDLSAREIKLLKRYVGRHKADTVNDGVKELRLLTLHQFLKELFPELYKSRSLLVAFNQPFDLSRVAHDVATARGRYAGGFSLGVWAYMDKNGVERRYPHRPRLIIKHIDSKRALIGLTARMHPDKEDLIPEGSLTGNPEKGYKFRGHFLDLRTLAFALTDRGHSLESACEAFEVKHGKQKVSRHGKITSKYIDYNRRDVLATSELADRLLEEYRKHRISLQVTKAFSPASIGKGYLRDMGIDPILRRQRRFPKKYLGYAQSAFFGGRTSAHIRKITVPIVYTDFLSMYPTVNSLMGLWNFVTAREIKVRKGCKREIQKFLRRVSPADLFKPSTWKRMPAFVRIIPNGDIVPSRSKYSLESNDWQVAVNHLSGASQDPNDGLWFSLPDIVASVLLTGRIPKIVDAFRIEPHGTLEKLKSIKLRSAVDIDPRTQDFFRVAIEQRKLLTKRAGPPDAERKRLDKALKVLANAASYGIYAEMIRQESDKKIKVTCRGISANPYICSVTHPENPGEYCFPPLASLITGAARLMLALLEHCVSKLGGTYAMEDTDSMAIVATKDGGVIPCPGGPQQTTNGQEAVKALSWIQVEGIAERFKRLNPYDRKAIPGSILKIEDDNFDPKTKNQRQLYCFAISAKRYALFLKDRNGVPTLLREGVNNPEDRWSQHGLGHLSNPTDLESVDRDWISKVWLNIIRRSLGLPTEKLSFEDVPAIGRMSVSSPAVMKPLAKLNQGKQYAQQIKPFNFLITCHVKELGHPPGVDPERFHLIAPYEINPRKWLKLNWINQYSNGNTFRITTAGHHGTRWSARVKTYGEVLEDYEYHPESKCADKEGNPCGKQTIGLLSRRSIQVGRIRFIGKESNSLEDVEGGLVHSEQNVYTEYPDASRDEWETTIRPALKIPRIDPLEKMSGMSRRAIIDLRAGRSRPHRRNRERLIVILQKLGVIPKN